MITVVTVYYDHIGTSVPSFSKCYTPEWVNALWRGIRYWYGGEFRFVCLTDRNYVDIYSEVEQLPLKHKIWSRAYLQTLKMEGERLAIMGLDTIITGALNDLFAYDGKLAVCKDVYRPGKASNSVVLCPPRPEIAALDGFAGMTDMTALDHFSHDFIDDLFPGQVVSYKGKVMQEGLEDARIVYFHGSPKPHELTHLGWVRDNWL